MSDEEILDISDNGGGDLFGDDDGDDAPAATNNSLDGSDDDLASDPGSEKRYGGDDGDEPGQQEFKTKTVMSRSIYRHGAPVVKDGLIKVVKVPEFLKFQPTEYRPDYEPDAWDIEQSRKSIPHKVVRFRRNPITGELESNSTIYKWSDGSLSLMVGEQHFVIQTKELAGRVPNKPYNAQLDAHTYAVAAHMASNGLITVGHVSEQYTIRPDAIRADADIQAIKEKMGIAKAGRLDSDMIVAITQDPELQNKQAEQAEKERSRAQRKQDNAAARVDGTGSAYKRGGLSVKDLEGRRATGSAARKRGQPGSSKRKGRSGGHRDDYDSDEGGGGVGGDGYDMEDDFIAPSDEEGGDSGAEEDEEEDLLDDDDDERQRPRTKRQKTAEASDADADADADPDDEDTVPATSGGDHGRRGRRARVIDDDEDE